MTVGSTPDTAAAVVSNRSSVKMEGEIMLPSWKDPDLGTMKRVALWLIANVGEGNEFTKEELRQTFPGVSQVDRRMRDLRKYGWQIDTNREDPGLKSQQQRFVKAGSPVWEGSQAVQVKATVAIGAARRREVITADGHLCRSCGITPGHTYEGTIEMAQLDIARREVQRPDGTFEIELITECNRCRVGGRGLTVDLGEALNAVEGLSQLERRVFSGWVGADIREFSATERLWGIYRALPEDSRKTLREALRRR